MAPILVHGANMINCLNYDKSILMAARTRQSFKILKIFIYELTISNNECEITHKKRKEKLLRVIIDENLNWTSHVDRLSLCCDFFANFALETTSRLCTTIIIIIIGFLINAQVQGQHSHQYFYESKNKIETNK